MVQTDPLLTSCFFQANTVKGYRFWDQMGLIANQYAGRFQRIGYGASGLVCAAPLDPRDVLQEIRANVDNIWLSLSRDADWQAIRSQVFKHVDWISQAIDVSDFSRFGLRVYYMWAGASLEDVTGTYSRRVLQPETMLWSAIGQVVNGEATIELVTEDVKARMSVNAVQNIDVGPPPASSLSRLPQFAIQADIDMSQEARFLATDLAPFVDRCARQLQERFLPHLSSLVDEEALNVE